MDCEGLAKAWLGAAFEAAAPGCGGGKVVPSKDSRFGDWQCNDAMGIAKRLGRNPRELAQAVVGALPLPEILEKAEVAGPGFINLTLSGKAVAAGVEALAADGALGVPQVGAAEIAAHRAIALGVDGALVLFVFQVLDVDDAAPGIQVAVAGVAAGHDAVEQVHPAPDALDDIAGGAYPHQIADLVLWHKGLHRADHPVHLLCRLSHRQPADGVAVQVQSGDALHVLDAQVIKGTTLIDAKQQLVGIGGLSLGLEARQLRLATLQPAHGALAAGFGGRRMKRHR